MLEKVTEALARRITEDIAIPTIGIGASAACDGQILVVYDMLGIFGDRPKFVKRYAELGEIAGEAIAVCKKCTTAAFQRTSICSAMRQGRSRVEKAHEHSDRTNRRRVAHGCDRMASEWPEGRCRADHGCLA
ncbi:3-methyl-2-oxobutanoate hydroxymethyltransferase [Mesorhizobium sp. M0730]